MARPDYTSSRNDFLTPPEVYGPILKKLKIQEFDLDVCCSIKNIPAKKHFINGKFDGLKEPWEKINWMNPPFSTCRVWVKKAFEEQKRGNTTYAILPARVETEFWRKYVIENKSAYPKYLLKNKKEGVTFIHPETLDYVRNKNGTKGLFKNPLAIVTFKGVKVGKA